VIISASNWTNAGTINLTNGSTITLGGNFKNSDIGTFSASADSNVFICGTLDNSNATLNINALGGTWCLGQVIAAFLGGYPSSGTINNGTIAIGSSNFSVYDGTLNNVTIIGGDLRAGSFGTLTIQNGLTVADHNVDLGVGQAVVFDGPSQTINNLNFVGPTISNTFLATIYPSGPDSFASQTLTLGADVNVHGGVQFLSHDGGDSLVNDGTIYADAPLTYQAGYDTTSASVIGVSSFTNNGTLLANDGELDILFGPWTNAGTISATNGSVVNLGGNFKTSDIGTFSASADSNVHIVGALDNSGATFSTGRYGGTWTLGTTVPFVTGNIFGGAVGTISNGTLDLSNGSLTVVQGDLDGVSVVGGDLEVVQDGTLTVQNGLTLGNHNLNLAPNAGIYFDAESQTVDDINIVPGNENIAAGLNTIYADGPNSTGPQTLTLGANATVHGGVGITYSRFYGDTLVNNGNINADNDNSINMGVAYFTNNGTAQATSGGELNLFFSTVFNTGTIAVHNGTINCPNGLAVGDGTLTGSGTIEGGFTMSSDPSTLAFCIGGETQGTDYDYMQVFGGDVTLVGNLEITLTHGFVPSPGDVFTVLYLEGPLDGPFIIGAFANVADNGRLETTDGGGSFLVNYGANNNAIILSDFVATPEPASLSLLAASACGLLTRRRCAKRSPRLAYPRYH
jgi:hypothetical protein